MTDRDHLFHRWELEYAHGRTPSYWAAVAALIVWDEDHPKHEGKRAA